MALAEVAIAEMPLGGPRLDRMAHQDFSFPAAPMTRPTQPSPTRRPASMHLNTDNPPLGPPNHRRAASTLPSFTFHSADDAGLQDNTTTTTTTPPESPSEILPTTPSRRGHKRGGSEFVGGDSRQGVEGAISSSPTKATALPMVWPPSVSAIGQRRHTHKRSTANSNHDIGSIMQPPEPRPRTSSSLPTTPLDFSSPSVPFDRTISPSNTPVDPFGRSLGQVEARPPSRPRVGFSDNVEIIPRPLSTISSETESSISTAQGHSVNNSISSILGMGTPSPPSHRSLRPSLGANLDDEASAKPRSSSETSRRVEKEGEWLKSRSLSQSRDRPLSESAAAPPSSSFAVPESSTQMQQVPRKKLPFTHALGFDRRKSEPLISVKADESSHLSTISLHGNEQQPIESRDTLTLERLTSAKKIKEWATARLSKKSRGGRKSQDDIKAAYEDDSRNVGLASLPGKSLFSQAPRAETDLDTVFSSQAPPDEPRRLNTPPQPRLQLMSNPTSSQHDTFQPTESEESSPMLDLNVALGPFQTAPLGYQRQRRELHSSRLTKDFMGPGGHYHRRIESAPESSLPVPEFGRMGTPPTVLSLPDVFEGDEDHAPEDACQSKPESRRHTWDQEAGVGTGVIHTTNGASWARLDWTGDNGLRIQRGERELERPSTFHASSSSRLSTPNTERRPSSIMEDTILEESGPVEAVEPVEIVEAHEEPRASSLTKSSDSSETPTLLAAPTAGLLPEPTHALNSPDSFQLSPFPSPDIARRQGSFETSRVGTSASSIADNRTMSSSNTGEQGHDMRISVDDVPSLTSSRSTMTSTMHANGSRRDFSDRASSFLSTPAPAPPAMERRRKRGSIQSLSQLVGGSFGSSGKGKSGGEDVRPQVTALPALGKAPKKKENRLKKLMFWRSKNQSRVSLLSAP